MPETPTENLNGLNWEEFPSDEQRHKPVIGAAVGLLLVVVITMLSSPWLKGLIAQSHIKTTTSALTALLIVCFLVFGTMLGWVIGSGRPTTTNKTTSSETSTTTTTRSA